MAPARRKKPGRSSPGWMWLLSGVLIGLGLAWFLWSKGYIPQPQADPSLTEEPAAQGDPGSAEEVAPAVDEPKKSRYDFFTVLPEMEVVVPEQELTKKSTPQQTPATQDDSSSYLLQVGSFREKSDAEQMKARLALLGITTQIQTVTVNGATWHRVRVAGFSTRAEAVAASSALQAHGFDPTVLRAE